MNLRLELEDHLAAEEDGLQAERLDRAIFLAQLGEPEDGLMLPNGTGVIRPWLELRWSYVQGCYQAVILVGQSFLENLLGGVVADFHDQAVHKPCLGDLVARVDRLGWLLPSEAREFRRFAQVRNPYAHYRSFHEGDSLISRSIAEGIDTDGLIKTDCERFLLALHSFVHRRFGLGPLVVPSEEELLPVVHPDQLEISCT